MVFDGPAWNKCTVCVISAARAHILCVMLKSYHTMLESATGAAAANVAVLKQIGELWGVEMILRNMGGVLESGALQPAEVRVPQLCFRDFLFHLPRMCCLPGFAAAT